MKRLLWSLASLAVLAGGTGRADAAVLWDQPTNTVGGFSSQNDPAFGGVFIQAFDNFKLTQTSTITSVDWVGSYFNPPTAGTFLGATISFYADAAGQPGTLLASELISGTNNETSLGFDAFGNPYASYSAILGTSFQATANTQYWLSIVPSVDFPPQWAWEAASGPPPVGYPGDNAGWQRSTFFAFDNAITSDLTFTLNGSVNPPPPGGVPEPASVVVWTLVAGIFAAGRFRKRQK